MLTMNKYFFRNNNNNNNNIKNNNDDVEMFKLKKVQEKLKRKTPMPEEEAPPAKVLELEYAIPSPSKPTPEIMGVSTPMEPDYSRLPKDFKLGNLAEEKYAGIVMADLYDRYEIQIYCRLFEHFSYYPIYQPEMDSWLPAHVHAYREVVRFRTPPSVLMRAARAAR